MIFKHKLTQILKTTKLISDVTYTCAANFFCSRSYECIDTLLIPMAAENIAAKEVAERGKYCGVLADKIN